MKPFTFAFCSLLFATILPPLAAQSLPRAALGERFPATAAEAFLNATQEKKMDLHSVMILKNGKVVYERWFGNDAPSKNHVMWSVGKTWTTMAVGFAIAEGKFTVEDKVISFFPNDLPAEVSENLAALRVKDLLTMSVGHDNDPTGSIRNAQGSWEKLLALPRFRIDIAFCVLILYSSLTLGYLRKIVKEYATKHSRID